MIVAGVALIGFLVVSILAAIATRHHRQDAIGRCRYRPRKSLMVGIERRVFQLLNEIFGQRFYIIPGVSLSSLLSHKVGSQNRLEAYGFIENKTVDFVFCNKQTLRPVCAVKIDDNAKNELGSSEAREMESFFRSAHLPFVRITKLTKLDRETIIEEFSRVIYETSLLDNAPQPPRRKRRQR